MFIQLSIPIIGVVENMSYLVMPDGSKNTIFGEGGGKRLAEELGVPLLGELPIDAAIRKGGDSGKPVVEYEKESVSARTLMDIACQMSAAICRIQNKSDKTG